MAEPIILGIDPAIASIGFGVIQGTVALDYGVISTSSDLPRWKRLEQIDQDVTELCRLHRPTEIGIETPFFTGKNSNAGVVQQALGVILLAIGRYLGREPKQFSASQVKASVCFTGGREKADVQFAVMNLFGLSKIPKPDDAADGLAIAYAVYTKVTSNIK